MKKKKHEKNTKTVKKLFTNYIVLGIYTNSLMFVIFMMLKIFHVKMHFNIL